MDKHTEQCTRREKADLVFKNCKVVNVYVGGIEECDIAVSDGIIVGVGHYQGKKEIDLEGAYVAPGLIDSHLHIESTMLSPANFAAAVMPYGITTCIADPHEIANVSGIKGVEYMIKEAKTVPMDIRFMLPSCVPATPFEDNGATIDAADTEKFIENPDIYGLGEFMNSPAVRFGDDEALRKLKSCLAAGKIIDGHLVTANEDDVNVYALKGIKTDHENVCEKDVYEKIKRGFYVQMREGTSTRNINALAGAFTDKTKRRLLLCTDDKQVGDLKERGHLDNNVRMLIKAGKDPVDVLTAATLNAAECYKMEDRGAIAPGKIADFVVFDDLYDFRAREVYKNGALAAKDGKALFEAKSIYDPAVRNTMHTDCIFEDKLKIALKSDKVKVIGIMPENVVTFHKTRKVNVENGEYVKTEGLDKICVVERHKGTGKIGLGLIEGYGLKNAAVALSVAHDSHNIIAIGDNDKDIVCAVNEIIRAGGGMTFSKNGKIEETLELPVGGIMSDRNEEYVYEKTELLRKKAREAGVKKEFEPFMCLSFMSLAVIPELKITTRGLFDVLRFDFTPIEEE